MTKPEKKLRQPDLTIVIPAYCEEKRIGQTLDKLAIYLGSNTHIHNQNTEVIVVAADAPDKTEEIVSHKGHLFSNFRLLKPGIRVGKGRDVQYGVIAAKGRHVLFMDADLATPMWHIEEFYKYNQTFDIVVGTRNLRKHHSSIVRSFISNVGNVLFKFASGLWLEDSQCGFKMFKASAAITCFQGLHILGWGFDMEILAIARVKEYKIKPVRIDDWQDKPGGTFNQSLLKTILRSFSDLAYIFFCRLAGTYKK